MRHKKLSDHQFQLSSFVVAMAAFCGLLHFVDSDGLVAADTVNLGTRRELFVDRLLIERLTNARLQLHAPHDEGPVLRFDARWEGPFAGYATLIQDEKKFRMYYRGISEPGLDGSEHERTCVAESDDGITWTKPKLGLFEYGGTTANNIVLADAAPVTHNFCPMLETRPGVAPEERYKAVGGTGKELFGYVSADGLKWVKVQNEPILSGKQMPFRFDHLFDSQNLVFWSASENCYVCYFRVWDGLRRIARSTSTDFRTWSTAVMMKQVHDDGVTVTDAPAEHLYTNQTSPYPRAPHIYLAIAARFFEGRQVLNEQQAKALNVDPGYFKDTSDAVLLSSRGGQIYDRTYLEGFLRPGIGPQNWVSRTNYPALNLAQTGPTELSLYVNQDYAQPTSHVRRYSLRLDGFASVRAAVQPGELLTKPFTFSGDELEINFSTSASGGIRFEFQNPDGSVRPGFALADCQEQIGNELDRIVTWSSGTSLQSLAGKPVRMRIVLQDADLFSFRFRDLKKP